MNTTVTTFSPKPSPDDRPSPFHVGWEQDVPCKGVNVTPPPPAQANRCLPSIWVVLGDELAKPARPSCVVPSFGSDDPSREAPDPPKRQDIDAMDVDEDYDDSSDEDYCPEKGDCDSEIDCEADDEATESDSDLSVDEDEEEDLIEEATWAEEERQIRHWEREANGLSPPSSKSMISSMVYKPKYDSFPYYRR